MHKRLTVLLIGAAALACAASAGATPDANGSIASRIRDGVGRVDSRTIENADSQPGNWMSYGRTYSEQRFSPLKQINVRNARKLGLAWYFDTGTRRSLEATPIVVDGIMYTTGSWSIVYALDARTGKLLWKFDPRVPRSWGFNACCDVDNRGVAVWKGRVYVGTLDGRLICLDAHTGRKIWSVETIPPDRSYTITGAPRIIDGKVIIGNGGAEYKRVRGYVSAYDAGTGNLLWRFYTVPGNPAKGYRSQAMKAAAGTWSGQWWKQGGGGTVWNSMAYDPRLNLLYIGTGNADPWNRYKRNRNGETNLYTASIVALDPDTGKMVWHFQNTPADAWDYDSDEHLILADLKIHGRMRKVIMQANKNGFFYVLDRTNGDFISARNFVPVTWCKRLDPETGRPVGVQGYRNKPQLTMPSPYGGHNWQPMSYNPQTGLVYIPAQSVPFRYGQASGWEIEKSAWGTDVNMALGRPPVSMNPVLYAEIAKALTRGSLIAWDPVHQKAVWRYDYKGPWNGPTLTTAGNLVFQGTADGHLMAFRADNGQVLWRYDTQSGISGSPVTYTVDGRQYVTVMAGWGGAFALASGPAALQGQPMNTGRILTFRVGGSDRLPPAQTRQARPNPPPLTPKMAKLVPKGNKLYHLNCAVCHGIGAVSASNIPDLRNISRKTHRQFMAIVLGGMYADKGMVSFAGTLRPDDVEAIHAYIIKRGDQELAREQEPGWWAATKRFFYSVEAKILAMLA